MTVKVSVQKVTKILRGYFKGIPQTQIAEKSGVDQSTVSLYASRFAEKAAAGGVLAAGKEYKVFEEVEALRSLSVELHKAGLTSQDAKYGADIIKSFVKLGVDPQLHSMLVKVCEEVEDPGFVHAALALGEIEDNSGMAYEEIVAELLDATSQLPGAKQQLLETKSKLADTESALSQKKEELADADKGLKEARKQAQAETATLKQGLLAKMKELDVTWEEVEQVAGLKEGLMEEGLDIPTLVKLVKEVGHE